MSRWVTAVCDCFDVLFKDGFAVAAFKAGFTETNFLATFLFLVDGAEDFKSFFWADKIFSLIVCDFFEITSLGICLTLTATGLGFGLGFISGVTGSSSSDSDSEESHIASGEIKIGVAF